MQSVKGLPVGTVNTVTEKTATKPQTNRSQPRTECLRPAGKLRLWMDSNLESPDRAPSWLMMNFAGE
jgi:hypothetical protein